jgi:hypothetical protein
MSRRMARPLLLTLTNRRSRLMETLAEFFERTKHKCQRSLRKLGHVHVTQSGTSVAADSDDPKNGGSKPEER